MLKFISGIVDLPSSGQKVVRAKNQRALKCATPFMFASVDYITDRRVKSKSKIENYQRRRTFIKPLCFNGGDCVKRVFFYETKDRQKQ